MNQRSYLQRFDQVELAIRRNGHGMPFVWGHSLMGSMKTEDQAAIWGWQEVTELVELVRYDARGHGYSDGSYRAEDYRWSQMAGDMLAVARSIAAETRRKKFILGGMSMGCATALEAAVQAPAEVAGLVLVLPPTAWDTRPRQAGIYRRLSWVSGLFGSAPYRILDWLPVPIREDGRSRLALHTARGLAMANPLQVQAALRGAAMSDMPSRETLRQLQVPVLILAWEDDAAHPLSTAEMLAETLPRVRDLVVCDPVDVSPWPMALHEFLTSTGRRNRSSGAPRKQRTA